eukprot:365423-Chlamydomonas_euryale.AAC.2
MAGGLTSMVGRRGGATCERRDQTGKAGILAHFAYDPTLTLPGGRVPAQAARPRPQDLLTLAGKGECVTGMHDGVNAKQWSPTHPFRRPCARACRRT